MVCESSENILTRVLFVAPHAAPYHAGLYRELNHATRQNMRFDVSYCDRTGSLVDVNDAEFCVCRKPVANVLDGYSYFFVKNLSNQSSSHFFSRINPSLFWIVKKYDIVILHGMGVFSYWIAFLSAWLHGRTIFMKGEATPELYQGMPSIVRKAREFLYTMVLNRCRFVFYSCEGNRAFWKMHGVPDEKLKPLPCAVDNAYLQTQAESLMSQRMTLREQCGFAAGQVVFVMACRMTSRKRPQDLIDAAVLLTKEGVSEFGLLFVGDGPERSALELRCKQEGIKAHFTGYVPELQMAKAYVLADVGVVISEYDPSPKSMNEMMNFSMPIICSRVVGTMPDLVHDGENGYVVDVGDVAYVAKAMRVIITDSSKRKHMGARSIDIVGEYTFARQAKAIRKAVARTTMVNYPSLAT